MKSNFLMDSFLVLFFWPLDHDNRHELDEITILIENYFGSSLYHSKDVTWATTTANSNGLSPSLALEHWNPWTTMTVVYSLLSYHLGTLEHLDNQYIQHWLVSLLI